VHKNRFEELNQKFLNNLISKDELQEFLNLLEENEDAFYDSLNGMETLDKEEFNQQGVFQNILNHEEFPVVPKPKRLNYSWLSLAAALLIISGFVFYTWNSNNNIPIDKITAKQVAKVENKTEPSIDKSAILLADGTHLDLEDIAAQSLNYDGVELSKISDDVIRVAFNKSLNHSTKEFHEFRTPKGTSYNLQLPDGTKVYLNSGSVFKLSADFNGNSRISELIGEAFFDVAHNPQKPFLVQTKDYTVKVLGTQFNLKSYPKSTDTKTSLLKGSVQVNDSYTDLLLVPGEQANGRAGKQLKKSKANFREVLAWREGYFRFSNASVREIMDDIVNWYDIQEVVYENNDQEYFTGSIVRSRSLQDVLKGIEKISNLKFVITEGRVIVRK